MIKANGIKFTYEKNKSFIENLDVNIEEGKVTTILGPNGSGKSTLLSILCGLNKISHGEVWINNKNIKKLSYKALAKEIATVHQQNSVPEDITVEELVSYGRTPHKTYYRGNDDEDIKIVQWAIEKTGLKSLRNKAVMSMSGGERQRVFIAMALAQKSKVLFLDEPTTYLDIYHQIEILELVEELNREEELTVVMVLHDINQALKYSHNIIIMKNGKIINEGNAKKVITMDMLNKVYNIGGFINETNDETFFVPLKLEA